MSYAPTKELVVHFVARAISVAVFMVVLSTSCAAATSQSIADGGPSFDCSTAATPIEKRICASRTLSELDRRLAVAYALARRHGGSEVVARQLAWLKSRNACASTARASIAACLQKAYRSRLATLGGRTLITRDISSLSQAQWLTLLSVQGRCSTSSDEKTPRFVRLEKLTNRTSLLLLACDLGAYQDSHLVFRLDRQGAGVVANLLTWLVPVYHGGWSLHEERSLGGDITLGGGKTALEVYYRSSGSGACGYIARYRLADVGRSGAIRPFEVKGHDDCLNGMRPDAWPRLELK